MPVYRVARPKGFLAFRLSSLRIISQTWCGPSGAAWDRDVGRQLRPGFFARLGLFVYLTGSTPDSRPFGFYPKALCVFYLWLGRTPDIGVNTAGPHHFDRCADSLRIRSRVQIREQLA